jgi:glycosyltransferase involved in cell wall biosynthesis
MMRVVIAGDYPEDPPNLVRGIQPTIFYTLQYLGNYDDLDIHVVTCEKWHDHPLDETRVVEDDRWTVHYLPSSPRIPHTLTMLTLDRWAVRRQIEALAPDVIHAHGQAAAYPFAAFDTGQPTAVTVHGINMLEAEVDQRGGALKGKLRVALWGNTERRCLRRARDIVVISPFVQQVIAPHTRARLHVIENPVRDAFLGIDPKPVPGKVFLVGSVQRRKGILEAVEAMALVRQQVPCAELYVAGAINPAYQAYCDLVQQQVAATGAEDYVHLLGHLGHEALLDAYRTSQVFFFPSWLESSPVAVAEAMAASLPSVVSDIGGIQHLIEDGVTGYRVPPGDVPAFAERIIHLLKNEDTRDQFGRQARKVASERFSGHMAARKTRDLYLSLRVRPVP